MSDLRSTVWVAEVGHADLSEKLLIEHIHIPLKPNDESDISDMLPINLDWIDKPWAILELDISKRDTQKN